MNFQQKFDFLQNRSLGSIITDTLRFVQLNFKSLFSILFYICFLPILIYSVISFLFFNNYFSFLLSIINLGAIETSNPDNIVEEILTKGLLKTLIYVPFIYIAVFTILIFISTTCCTYVKLYQNNVDLTTSTVWNTSKKYLAKVTIFNIWVFVLMLVGSVICFIPLFLGKIGILITFFLFLIYFVCIFYFSIKIMFSPLFIILEDKGIIDSIKESFKFTKNIFWKTFLFLFVLGIIISFISSIFQMPGMLLLYVNMIMGIAKETTASETITTLSSVLIGLGSAFGYLVYSLQYIGMCTFYYSSIEKEQGTKDYKILDSIGVNDDNDD